MATRAQRIQAMQAFKARQQEITRKYEPFVIEIGNWLVSLSGNERKQTLFTKEVVRRDTFSQALSEMTYHEYQEDALTALEGHRDCYLQAAIVGNEQERQVNTWAAEAIQQIIDELN